MAPPPSGWKKDEDEDESIHSVEEDLDDLYPSSTTFQYVPPPPPTPPPLTTGSPYPGSLHGPRPPYTDYTQFWPPHVISENSYATNDPYSKPKATPWPDYGTPLPSSTPSLIASQVDSPTSSATEDEFAGRRPGWNYQHDQPNSVPMYAAASVIPVVLLAIIGAAVFICLRKRKRQRQQQQTSAQLTAHEMAKRSTSIHQYMVPSQVPAPQYTPPISQLPPTSIPSQLQPVILGPIPSGTNGAYLTGMDTSDMVSITSNHLRPADQYAETTSLSEPPPPYRPNSAAPPSFCSNSRQSSVRSSAPLPTTSRTRLIEGSPFDDAQEVDNVSDLSGPTGRHHDDSWSVVSDLSYQRDPFSDRPRYGL